MLIALFYWIVLGQLLSCTNHLATVPQDGNGYVVDNLLFIKLMSSYLGLTSWLAPRFRNLVPAYRHDLLAIRAMKKERPYTEMLFCSQQRKLLEPYIHFERKKLMTCNTPRCSTTTGKINLSHIFTKKVKKNSRRNSNTETLYCCHKRGRNYSIHTFKNNGKYNSHTSTISFIEITYERDT